MSSERATNEKRPSSSRVKESPVNMECKAVHIIELSDKPWGGTIIIGEVILFHVRDSIIDKDVFIDPDKLNPIARMGGPSYSTIKDRFDMVRPVIDNPLIQR